jgi:P27 family predicted phage terminase small subunit
LEEWHRLAPEIYNNGLLTVCDITMFSCYCVAYDLWRRAAEAHHKATQTKNQDLQITLARVTSLASADLLRLAQQFGFTPASRTRISVEPQAAPSKFGDLFGPRAVPDPA